MAAIRLTVNGVLHTGHSRREHGKPYWPQRGQDAPVPITIEGVLSEALVTRGADTQTTYSYLRIEGETYYIKGHIPYNAAVRIVN